MKRKMTVYLLLFLAILFGVIIIITSCERKSEIVQGNFDGPVDISVSKGFLLTKHLDSGIFVGDSIDYNLVKIYYPHAKLVLLAGYQVDLGSDGIVGFCKEAGVYLNRGSSDVLGLLQLSKNGEINFSHGLLLNSYDSKDTLYSAIQVLSLVRDNAVLSLYKDIKEDQYVVIEDEDGESDVWFYENQYPSKVVEDLKSRNVRSALKLGGGSVNGGVLWKDDGSVYKIGNINSPAIVSAIVFE